MPSYDYRNSVRLGAGGFSQVFLMNQRRQVWEVSPRIGNRLILKSNPHERYVSKISSINPALPNYWATSRTAAQGGLADGAIAGDVQRLYNEAYAKFRGKLYQGKASLGVTAASYRQSRELIVNNYGRLTQRAERAFVEATNLVRRGKGPKALSSFYLEHLFGSAPLIADIQAAATTVIQKATPDLWVSGSAKTSFNKEVDSTKPWDPYSEGYRDLFIGSASVRYSCKVRVTNPNLWLAERAGALNVAAVAWDLVPWSFVVNMFVNTGSLVNSITDFAGLSFSDGMYTVKSNNFWRGRYGYKTKPFVGAWISQGSTEGWVNHKKQILSPIARPTLMLQLPDVNWGLAATAAALYTQKLGALTRVVRLVSH